MAERLHKLQETLAELESELSQIDSLDEAEREHLSQVASEILARVARQKPASSGAAVQPTAATKVDASNLRDRAKTFEEKHPQLSAIIFRVVDLLGQAGI